MGLFRYGFCRTNKLAEILIFFGEIGEPMYPARVKVTYLRKVA